MPEQEGFLVPPTFEEYLRTVLLPDGTSVWNAGKDQDQDDPGQQRLIATKHACYLTVPEELLMDMGVIPDTRPPLPPFRRPLRERLRLKAAPFREWLGARVYRLITGFDVPSGDWDE